MMSIQGEVRFFPANMEIQLASTNISTQGMISRFGVSRMLFSVSLLEQLKVKGQFPVTLKVGDLAIPVVLTQQFTEQGMSYGARFGDLTAEQQRFLDHKIQKEGVRAGWGRRFPRLRVTQLPGLPCPRRCVFPWLGKEESFEVVDFAMGGFRLRKKAEVAGLKVGRTLSLTIYDHQGASITGIEAEVRNFCVLLNHGAEPITEIGLRFLEVSSPGRDGYQDLFRRCVEALTKRSS